MFFESGVTNEILATVQWKLPWFFIVLFTALNFVILALLSIFEGCGYIQSIYRMRLNQTICSSVFAWLALYCGFGLYIPAISAIVATFFGLFWLNNHCFNIMRQFYRFWRTNSFVCNIWKQEILPLQWRIAVSWVSGYFIFQMLTPLAFKFYSPVAAGKIGMSLNIINMLLTISLSWINTKMPEFGGLIAKNKVKELNEKYLQAHYRSCVFFILIAVVFIMTAHFLNALGISISERMLDVKMLVVLSLGTLGRHVIGSQAYYIRSYNLEKHMWNAIYTGLLMVIILPSIAFLNFPEQFLIIAYSSVIIFFCLPHSYYIYRKFVRSKI